MPFKSKKQERYMYAKHPAIAKRWAQMYGGADPQNNFLPQYEHDITKPGKPKKPATGLMPAFPKKGKSVLDKGLDATPKQFNNPTHRTPSMKRPNPNSYGPVGKGYKPAEPKGVHISAAKRKLKKKSRPTKTNPIGGRLYSGSD